MSLRKWQQTGLHVHLTALRPATMTSDAKALITSFPKKCASWTTEQRKQDRKILWVTLTDFIIDDIRIEVNLWTKWNMHKPKTSDRDQSKFCHSIKCLDTKFLWYGIIKGDVFNFKFSRSTHFEVWWDANLNNLEQL